MTDVQAKRSDWSYCPACGGGIDTGYECNKCGRDWLEFHETRQELLDKCSARERAVWEEAAKEFEENWDGGDKNWGKPTYLKWLKEQAKEAQP